MVSVRFRALTANSKQIRASEIINGFGNAQKKWAEETKRKLQIEPPPIPDSKYKRTGKLVAGWKVSPPSLGSSGLIVRLTNSVPYVVFVHGSEDGGRQFWVHKGRWTHIKDAIDRESYVEMMRNVVKNGIHT